MDQISEESVPASDLSDSEDETEYELSIVGWLIILLMLLGGWIFPVSEQAVDPTFHGFASIFYVLFDALLLYVPLINEDIQCVTVDKRLMISAVVFRAISGLRYIVRIFRFLWKGTSVSTSRKKLALSILLEILCLLPIPEVVVWRFIPNMRGFSSLMMMKFLNALIVLQYVARAYPIYKLYKDSNMKTFLKNSNKLQSGSFRIFFNFFAFVLASHVLGAFWYFFSILREIDCWGHASKFEYGGIFSISCDGGTLTNATLINKHCPINPADASEFDFGIFLYVLQSGMQESTNFPQKFIQCFSWGLQNLSSFASNLSGSTYVWENLFVALISLSGLILFIYLLGHVQTFMQKYSFSSREKSEDIILRVMDIYEEYDLPFKTVLQMERVMKAELKNDEDLVVENTFSFLSSKLTKDIDDRAKSCVIKIKHTLFMDQLKKVVKLENKCEEVLTEICEKLEPMIYSKGCYIIKRKEPLDMMFFVTRGIVLTYATNTGGSSGTIQMKKDKDFLYGEELITWAEEDSSCELSNLPISAVTVKCYNEVEVFALSATDLQRIVSKYPSEFNMNRTLAIYIGRE